MNIQNDKKQQKRDLYAIDDASALFEAIGAEPMIDDSDDSDDDLMNEDGMFDPNKILDVKPYEGPESGSRFPQEEIPEFNDEEKQFVVEQAAQKLASLPDKKISLEDLAQVATVIKGENGFRQDVYEFLKNTINESEKRLAAQNVSQEQPSGVVSAENTGADATVTTDAIPPMVEVQPTVPEKTPDLTPIVGKETIPDSLGVQSNDTLDIDNINAIGNETNDIGDVGADDLSALGFNTDSTDDTTNFDTKDADSSVDNDNFSIDGLDKLADSDFDGDSDNKETEDTKTTKDEKKDEPTEDKKDIVKDTKDTDEKKDESALESVDTKTKAVTESENGEDSLSEDGISDSTDASDSTDEVMTEAKNKIDCEKKAKLESVRNDYINKCEQKKKAIALESIIEQCDTELNGGINKKQRLIATLESISTKYKQENRTERLNAIVESYNKGKTPVENISNNDTQEKKAKLESVANIYKETVKKNDEIDKKLNAVLVEAQTKLKNSNEKEQIKNNFKKLNEQKEQIKNKI